MPARTGSWGEFHWKQRSEDGETRIPGFLFEWNPELWILGPSPTMGMGGIVKSGL